MGETFTYLKSFFKDKDVASVTPTSNYCVEHVCRPVDFSKDLTIVEYGAGAGVFADYLLQRMTPNSTLVMFETNLRLFEKLKEYDQPAGGQIDCRVILHKKSVEHVDKVLDKSRIGKVDVIISGIPFSFLNKSIQKSILQRSKKVLRPGGRFLAYQTKGHLKQPLKEIFGNVHTEWEWRNIPPMTIYQAEKEE